MAPCISLVTLQMSHVTFSVKKIDTLKLNVEPGNVNKFRHKNGCSKWWILKYE